MPPIAPQDLLRIEAYVDGALDEHLRPEVERLLRDLPEAEAYRRALHLLRAGLHALHEEQVNEVDDLLLDARATLTLSDPSLPTREAIARAMEADEALPPALRSAMDLVVLRDPSLAEGRSAADLWSRLHHGRVEAAIAEVDLDAAVEQVLQRLAVDDANAGAEGEAEQSGTAHDADPDIVRPWGTRVRAFVASPGAWGGGLALAAALAAVLLVPRGPAEEGADRLKRLPGSSGGVVMPHEDPEEGSWRAGVVLSVKPDYGYWGGVTHPMEADDVPVVWLMADL